MQTHFEIELEKLKKRIIKMFNLAGNQLNKSFLILMNNPVDSLEEIKDDENKIDKIDIKIDIMCQRLFALTQPIARDLRFIMGSLGISNEVERIGDMAYDLSKQSDHEAQFVDYLKQYNIPHFLDQIKILFNQVLESYTNGNSQLAAEIINESKILRSNKDILNDIVIEMTQKPEIITIATDLIQIINKLDRIVGHIENIAESIVFIVDGKIIKHPNLESKK
jgi:phosphate transport system protein